MVAAAVLEFARAGKDGARIDAIAATAGMNKRLLYHYVGDKEALFAAALRASVDNLAGVDSSLATDVCWRMLVHSSGSASGSASGVAAETDHQAIARNFRQKGESAEQLLGRVAVNVLGHLLPELAEALRNSQPSAVAGNFEAVAIAGQSPGPDQRPDPDQGPGRKPRIRLKPDLRQA